MTCAACHTSQIEFNGKKIVIDGAPGMGDLEGFLQGLVESMEATLKCPSGDFMSRMNRLSGGPS